MVRTASAQTINHQAGLPIAALDISSAKTHAVLAGKEILKVVRVADRKITEDLNIRSSIIQHTSIHARATKDICSSERKDYLSAADVKWSHGKYDAVIATAANNGRISVYDLGRPDLELLWLHQHSRQVHKLAFNPFEGALLLSAGHDGLVNYWDLRAATHQGSTLTLNSVKHFPARADPIRDLRWSPLDGVEFITSTEGGTILKWDSRRPDRPELRLHAHERACYAVDWHPDARHVISAGADKTIRVWDMQNPDRRQKPSFHFRTPHSVMNLRWRPASSHSSTSFPSYSTSPSTAAPACAGWPTSQVAVGYGTDDPRLHIWDFCSPWLPNHELDRFNGATTDLLWAAPDLLWTVNREGSFAQTNVPLLPQPLNDISPCTTAWLATGQHAVFSEDRPRHKRRPRPRPTSVSLDDRPSRLADSYRHSIVPDQDLGTAARTAAEERGNHDRFKNAWTKSASINKRGSVRSTKSLGDTPPSRDEITSGTFAALNARLSQPSGISTHNQMGIIGTTPGATTEVEVASFLAQHYVRPASEAHRREHPSQILNHLEQVFITNAQVARQVARYRLAQTWEVLGSVIIHELQAWADKSRRERLNRAAQYRNDTSPQAHSHQQVDVAPTLHPDSPGSSQQPPAVSRVQQLSQQTRLLPSTLRHERADPKKDRSEDTSHEDSASIMTTPLAKPFPDSYLIAPNKLQRIGSKERESVTTPFELAPPTATMATDSAAAAAASMALREELDRATSHGSIHDDDDDPSGGYGVSPCLTDTASGKCAKSMETPGKQCFNHAARIGTARPSWTDGTRIETQPNQDMSGLRGEWTRPREFKATARPLLTFDMPSVDDASHPGPLLASNNEKNSFESMDMFSDSTHSSQKTRYLTTQSSSSLDAGHLSKTSTESEDWRIRMQGSFGPSLPSSSREDMPNWRSRLLSQDGDDADRSSSRSSKRSTSPFPDPPFEFEEPRQDHHMQTPVPAPRRSPLPHVRQLPQITSDDIPVPTSHEYQSLDYIYADLHPPDISSYYAGENTKSWSALPLVAQAIAFDLGLGDNHAQFSSHLLMHIHPFFFNRRFRRQKLHGIVSQPASVAERLLQPHLAPRLIESIFEQYHGFLKSLSLHVLGAELRNHCVELDITSVYQPRIDPEGNKGGDSPGTFAARNSQNYTLAVNCNNPTCRAPLHLDAGTPIEAASMWCKRCGHAPPSCPICFGFTLAPSFIQPVTTFLTQCCRSRRRCHRDGRIHRCQTVSKPTSDAEWNGGLWTFCPACGHSAHAFCMSKWLCRPTTQGECPTPGCGHDCAPGERRRQRIAQMANGTTPTAAALGSIYTPIQDDLYGSGDQSLNQLSEQHISHGRQGTSNKKRGQNNRSVRSSAAVAFPRDSRRIRPSPAVDTARNLLRAPAGFAAPAVTTAIAASHTSPTHVPAAASVPSAASDPSVPAPKNASDKVGDNNDMGEGEPRLGSQEVSIGTEVRDVEVTPRQQQ